MKKYEKIMEKYFSMLEQETPSKTLIGKHNDIPDSEFDKNELEKGIKIEMEHTDNPEIAKAIAKDHLSECKKYYTFLESMERKCKGE
jgi:hypothetical protein